jgi:hypothetical protein
MEQGIKQRYAHFHRLLNKFMNNLTQGAKVTWIEAQGNVKSARHLYRQAVYETNLSNPQDLAALSALQQGLVTDLGHKRPPPELLLPHLASKVEEVKIRTSVQASSNHVKREQFLRGLGVRRQILNKQLEEARDEALPKAVIQELKSKLELLDEIEETAKRVGGHFRRRASYRQTICTLLYPSRDYEDVYLNHMGLIVNPCHITWAQALAKPRRDKISAAPLFVFDGAAYFLENEYYKRT